VVPANSPGIYCGTKCPDCSCADFPGDVIHHGFVWKNGQLTDLGTVSGDSGDLCTKAFGINSQGKIVGTSSNCQGLVQHLLLWENGHIVNLNSLLLPGPAIHLEHAYDINDRDEIAASGTLPNGDYHAVLLIPCDTDHSHVEGCQDHVEELVDADDRSLATAQVPTQTSNPTGRAREVVRKRTGSRDYVRRQTIPESPE
jgi:probable HAF family extracellular repeat protein